MRRLVLAAALLAATPAAADPMLADFDYPHPVQQFALQSQGQALTMAYMDVAPTGAANGRTAVLLHGKNFCGATWESQIAALAGAGYRVIVPDQIGFCKSSKPAAYQFGLHQLAANTRALLAELGVTQPVIIGHSMGGMLAMRYALSHGAELSGLVLVNLIGLEDWRALGVPPQTVDTLFQNELKTDAASIRRYQQVTYYDGDWKPEYDRWVEMLAGMYTGEGGRAVAWNQALTSDMVVNQPVVHELENIAVPTLLLIGLTDITAIGKPLAPPEAQAKMGNYAKLGKAAAVRIPQSKLIEWPALGHSPQVQDADTFNRALLDNMPG